MRGWREGIMEVLGRMWLQRTEPEVRAAELGIIICRFPKCCVWQASVPARK